MEMAFMPIFAQVPQPSEDEILDLLKPAQQIYASKGVTAAQEGATHAEELEFLRKAGATGRLYIDIVSLPFVAEVPKIFRSYLSTDNNAKKIVVLGDPSVEFNVYKDRLKLRGIKLRGIKLVADGSPEGKTAFWTKPLLTGGPNGETEWVGQPIFPKETIEKLYDGITQKNIQAWTHANGDAAIDLVISAAEKAGVKAGDDRRYIVIQSQCMRPEQLDAYVKLGLSPSFFSPAYLLFGAMYIWPISAGTERSSSVPEKRADERDSLLQSQRFYSHTGQPVVDGMVGRDPAIKGRRHHRSRRTHRRHDRAKGGDSRAGIVTLQCGEREAPAAQELSGCCDCSPPRGHRRSAKGAVRLG
jgi:predicted amidohydrolase YtcJ